MGHEFDDHTAVTRDAQGRYHADLVEGWTVGGGLNGGYLIAVLAGAIAAELPERPDPISLSAYFLSPGAPGPATAEVAVVREGGSVSTLSADLRQGAAHRITALASYGVLPEKPDDVRTYTAPPDLPPPDECLASADVPEDMKRIAPLMSRYDLRLPRQYAGWVSGRPSGRGAIGGWIRLADGREPDPVLLLAVLDALPPVTFELGMPGWAPTIELTAHVRARPAPGWLRVHHETRNLTGGMFEEDCEVWDSAGRLVAQSRQLARTPADAAT